jgi:hypothetical protein
MEFFFFSSRESQADDGTKVNAERFDCFFLIFTILLNTCAAVLMFSYGVLGHLAVCWG